LKVIAAIEASTCTLDVIENMSDIIAAVYEGECEEVNVRQRYDYYTGEPLDHELYELGKADELDAMQECDVYDLIPLYEATDGKHVRGKIIAHMKGSCVRWRLLAMYFNNTSHDDTHAGTPPLVAVRYVVSAAGSYPDAGGEHFRHLGVWDVRKAYFNAPLDELVYLHPGAELCPKGYCWRLKKALYGTRKASSLGSRRS